MSTLSSRPRFASGEVSGRWTVAWLGGSILGVVNGSLRELLYKDSVGERRAHYISTATLMALLGIYIWMLEQRWPLTSEQEAVRVGITWSIMTASFDFGFGHFIAHKSWAELAKDYDITAGRVWILILLWMGLAPEGARRLRESRMGARP
jgi:ABC-type branched-subunit amino acid transport system permease subunit